MTLEIKYPNIAFPFEKYDAKIPTNSFRVGKSINNIKQRVSTLQDRPMVEGISIDTSSNVFLRDDAISIKNLLLATKFKFLL